MAITKTSLGALKTRYAKSNGTDQEAGNELQRRGLNSKQLREILWEHGQQGWQKQAKRASKIHTAQRTEARIQKKRKKKKQRGERRRQEQIARVARLKEGGRQGWNQHERKEMHTIEELMGLLCCCVGYHQCDFHRILNARLITHDQLREEMEEILMVSHGIEREEWEIPDDWEPFKGNHHEYWRPMNFLEAYLHD